MKRADADRECAQADSETMQGVVGGDASASARRNAEGMDEGREVRDAKQGLLRGRRRGLPTLKRVFPWPGRRGAGPYTGASVEGKGSGSPLGRVALAETSRRGPKPKRTGGHLTGRA
jgi:hypothetical protein